MMPLRKYTRVRMFARNNSPNKLRRRTLLGARGENGVPTKRVTRDAQNVIGALVRTVASVLSAHALSSTCTCFWPTDVGPRGVIRSSLRAAAIAPAKGGMPEHVDDASVPAMASFGSPCVVLGCHCGFQWYGFSMLVTIKTRNRKVISP